MCIISVKICLLDYHMENSDRVVAYKVLSELAESTLERRFAAVEPGPEK